MTPTHIVAGWPVEAIRYFLSDYGKDRCSWPHGDQAFEDKMHAHVMGLASALGAYGEHEEDIQRKLRCFDEMWEALVGLFVQASIKSADGWMRAGGWDTVEKAAQILLELGVLETQPDNKERYRLAQKKSEPMVEGDTT